MTNEAKFKTALELYEEESCPECWICGYCSCSCEVETKKKKAIMADLLDLRVI